jgi:ribosome modulation factor
MTTDKSPWEMGYDAGISGKEPSTCPFESADERTEWAHGFDAGEKIYLANLE